MFYVLIQKLLVAFNDFFLV